MASPEPALTVIRSPIANDDLHEIWMWNAERYGPEHADAYLSFLEERIDDLARNYSRGQAVVGRLDLRFVRIGRKARKHEHIAVYSVHAGEVNVLHVFHSAQNWQAKLDDHSDDTSAN